MLQQKSMKKHQKKIFSKLEEWFAGNKDLKFR